MSTRPSLDTLILKLFRANWSLQNPLSISSYHTATPPPLFTALNPLAPAFCKSQPIREKKTSDQVHMNTHQYPPNRPFTYTSHLQCHTRDPSSLLLGPILSLHYKYHHTTTLFTKPRTRHKHDLSTPAFLTLISRPTSNRRSPYYTSLCSSHTSSSQNQQQQ